MSDPGSVRPAPATWLLLQAVFADEKRAGQWLERPNAAFGGIPLQLIAQDREREVQNYLSRLLAPADAPPAAFESLIRPQSGSPA